MTYNPAGNIVHEKAKTLMEQFNDSMERQQRRGIKRKPTDSHSSKSGSGGSGGSRSGSGAGSTASSNGRKRSKKSKLNELKDDCRPPVPITINKDVCTRVLEAIRTHDCAGPFLQPINPAELEIPNYFEIIKNPMDLGTVQKRLKAGYYRTNEEFATDTRLIFENCITFNGVGPGVSRMAKQLMLKFERMLTKLLPPEPTTAATTTTTITAVGPTTISTGQI
jgi:Bromodomain